MAEEVLRLEALEVTHSRQELVWHAVLLPNYTLMAEEVLRLEALEGFNCHSLTPRQELVWHAGRIEVLMCFCKVN